MIRSFVAVDIPAGVRDEVGRLQTRLRQPSDGIRWVRTDRMHLTLVFLGEVGTDFLDLAKEALVGAAAQHRRFEAQLGGLGAFPTAGRARVVWVGMSIGSDDLCALQGTVVGALVSIGYQPERRPFSPHLTLGRLRTPADVQRVSEQTFASSTFEVGRVVLFQSVLKPTGPEYTELAEFPLTES